MDTSSSERSPVRIVLFIIIAVAVGAAGWYLGYQAGWQKAKKVVEESGLLPATEGVQVTNILGAVQEVGDGTMQLAVRSIDPFAPEELQVRTVIVDDSTSIGKLSLQITPPLGKKAGVPSATTTPLALGDIRVGDFVSVDAGEDIRTAKTFTATAITVLPPASSPPQASTTPAS